jgi:hypothetical protein
LTDDPIRLAAQAERCRRLASGCGDDQTRDTLRQLAHDYERRCESAIGEQSQQNFERQQDWPRQREY